MTSGDLAVVISDYPDLPTVIIGPGGNKYVVQKIEIVGDKDQGQKLHIQLSFMEPPATRDPVGWQKDLTGI